MNRRLQIAIWISLLAIASVAVWKGTRSTEPVYEGKTLSRWMDRHSASSSAVPPYGSPGWHKAEEALRHIGTNGIPTLLKMLRATGPAAIVLKLRSFAYERGLIRTDYRYARQRNEEAEYVFRILGTDAASAVPELIRIYEANVSRSSQDCAALSLASIGPAASAAVPALLKNFTHTNGEVRFYAVSAIYHIGGDPKVLLPALKGALKDSNPSVRWNAACALMQFRDRSVAPAILEVLDDPVTLGRQGLKQQLEEALWYLAPETVGKPLIVEDATPMVADGKTTQTVDALYNGVRRTLLKPGRKVPTLMQFWDSGPRDPLTLYRRTGQPGEQDHFLGEFEVMGIPPQSIGANISLLCIIAEQRIFLAARDNENKAFLEIRRVK